MKKSDIYKAYGVEYRNGKILAPTGDYIAPLLKKGNSKTGAAVWTYSQLAGAGEWPTKYGTIRGTCAGTCEHCYACTGFYCMPSVRDALAMHTILTRRTACYTGGFKARAIIAQIKADNIALVRIHAAGDFDSVDDVRTWADIVKACPGVLFWTYTKRAWPEIDELNTLENINIVPSVICGRVNYGTCSDLLNLMACDPDAYICPCGFDDSTHCQDCKACATKKHVIFLLHSTPDYKSELDPLYSELKAVFEKQAAN